MPLRELILCSAAPQSPESGMGAIFLHDIQNGTTLASFKQTSASNHCTAVLESTNTEGGFILSAQPEKSILNVYNFQKDQIALRIVLPEKLTCIAIDRRGYYCAGGTAQGRIYLWEIASGILFNSWNAHYRRVSVLQFTNDGTALLSGSEDSAVNVWLIARLVDNDSQLELPSPHCTFNDHTLPITDIKCGLGASLNCRILTSSVDHSVKLWDLSSGALLTTFQFSHIVTHLAWEVAERVFFAATPDGSIYRVNLFRSQKDKHGQQIMEAVGGGGTSDIVRVEEDDTQKRRLISVGEPISSIAISLTSTYLIAGTSNGAIHLYDLPSHQLIRTIVAHKGFSITYLTSFLKPPDLIGHISMDLKINSLSDAKDALPAKPIQPFQKMKDSKNREAHDVALLLHPKHGIYQDDVTEYNEAEFLQDHASLVQPSLNQGQAHQNSVESTITKTRIADLEAEVMQLKEQLGRAKGINDTMWDVVVEKLANLPGEKEPAKEDNDDSDQRRRKRSRGA